MKSNEMNPQGKKSFWKNRLDERQEEVLLTIEHLTCWVGIWGLFAVITVQLTLLGRNLREVAGEMTVFALMILTLLIGCVSQGIWDRHLALSWKTNLGAALIAGLVILAVNLAAGWVRFHAIWDWPAYVIPAVLCFIVTFLLMTLISFLTKKRLEKLEEE